MGTAVGLSTDLHKGVMDRFRTLPCGVRRPWSGDRWPTCSRPCVRRDVALTGLAGGWRPDASFASVIAGFALMLFFAYAVSWVSACMGLNAKNPETASSLGLIMLLPLTFMSKAIVPTQGMPDWTRTLWGNPNRSSTIHAWPMHHPIEAALIWSVVILAVAAPAASHFFKARAAG